MVNTTHVSFVTFYLHPPGFSDAAVPKVDSKLLHALLPSLPAAIVVLLIEVSFKTGREKLHFTDVESLSSIFQLQSLLEESTTTL
jgi:hypothetical protein